MHNPKILIMNSNKPTLLSFVIEKQRFAVLLSVIEQVIRAVEITRLSDSPGFIEGVIDYYGEVIAVINLRKRLGYLIPELRLSDRFIIVKTQKRKLALIVDNVEEVILPDSEDWYDSQDINKGLKFINILRNDDGIILIYDVEDLLGESEEIDVDKFLKRYHLHGNGL